MIVIGITGSYGKGSTKGFLAKILSENFNVVSTYSTFNTPIGIAKTIMNAITSETEIFVVEMGAYKRGEVAEMASMVSPKIGILTSVNDQHISLFGSLENTIATKYELIESLPRGGLALFNGNNLYTKKLYTKSKKRKGLYFAAYNNEEVPSDIMAKNIKVNKFYITFDAMLSNKNLGRFRANLIGKHNVENILPGVYVANYLGMSINEIKNAVQKLSPLTKTMEPYLSGRKAVLIDDSYNANPASVIAAVEYMKIYKGKKILVLQPIIELGRNARQDHYNVALKIGRVCNMLILTNKNFKDEIVRGITDSEGKCDVSVLSPLKAAQLVDSSAKTGDVVIFEGKEAGNVLSLVDHQKI